jgi:hypothetical protein
LHVNIETQNNYGLNITDVLGNEIYNSQNTPEIDLSTRTDGIYFVTITTGAKQYRQKIIKN